MNQRLVRKEGAVYRIGISDATPRELEEISAEMGLALSLEEMQQICKYFQKKGRDPTDIELQALGQAWSEHCCYKSSKPILQKFSLKLSQHLPNTHLPRYYNL